MTEHAAVFIIGSSSLLFPLRCVSGVARAGPCLQRTEAPMLPG